MRGCCIASVPSSLGGIVCEGCQVSPVSARAAAASMSASAAITTSTSSPLLEIAAIGARITSALEADVRGHCWDPRSVGKGGVSILAGLCARLV